MRRGGHTTFTETSSISRPVQEGGDTIYAETSSISRTVYGGVTLFILRQVV